MKTLSESSESATTTRASEAVERSRGRLKKGETSERHSSGSDVVGVVAAASSVRSLAHSWQTTPAGHGSCLEKEGDRITRFEKETAKTVSTESESS